MTPFEYGLLLGPFVWVGIAALAFALNTMVGFDRVFNSSRSRWRAKVAVFLPYTPFGLIVMRRNYHFIVSDHVLAVKPKFCFFRSGLRWTIAFGWMPSWYDVPDFLDSVLCAIGIRKQTSELP